jgi:hypothetical protein
MTEVTMLAAQETQQRLTVAEWRDFGALQKTLDAATAAKLMLRDLAVGISVLNHQITNACIFRKAADRVQYEVVTFDSIQYLEKILNAYLGGGLWRVFEYVCDLKSLPDWQREGRNAIVFVRETVELAPEMGD